MANPISDDSVQFSVYIDAASALASLGDLKTNASSMGEIFDAMANKAIEFSQKTQLSLGATQSLFKRVIADAENLKSSMAALPELAAVVGENPRLASLLNVQNPFTTTVGNPMFDPKMLEGLNAQEAALLKTTQQVGLTLSEGMAGVRARLQEILTGMENVNKDAALFEKNMNKAADAAAATAARLREVPTVLGKSIESPQQASALIQSLQAINNLDFSKVQAYKANVSSLMTTIKSLGQQTGAQFEQIGKYITDNFQNIPKVAVTDAIKGLNNELRNVEPNAKKAVKGLDAVRIALGAIVAMLVFQAIQAVGNFFRSMIKGASDLEMAFYRLEKVERSLSKAGVDITPKGLAQGIKEIKDEFGFLSDVDVSQLLGNVALLTKNLKLSQEEIIKLSKAIVVLNINSQDNEDILQTSSKVITSMLTDRAVGVAGLGLSFNDAAKQAMGLKLGILQAGQAMSDLTEQQKNQIKLGIIFETAGLTDQVQLLKDAAAYSNTLEGKTNTLKSAWEQFTAALGQVFSPILKEAFNVLIFSFNRFNEVVKAAAPLLMRYYAAVIAFMEAQHNGTSFSEEYRKALEEVNKTLGGLGEAADTPTGAVEDLGDSMLDLTAAMEKVNFKDLLNDLEDFQRKLGNMNEDFNQKIARMAQDFGRDMLRDWQDYNRDVLRVQEDYAKRRQEAEQDYRNREIDNEAKFQERLRQLREKFLFNLEDALHERDARQVLRLIREYQMEKQNIINEEALRGEAAQREHQQDMERLKQEEADRLRQMEEEFRIRQQRAAEDYLLKVQREQEEHQQDMDRLKEQIDERLKTFADKLAEELGLREGGAEEIYKVLQKYYGAGGYFDGLYDYSAKSMAARASEMMSMLQQVLAQYAAVASGISSTPIAIPGLGSAPRPIINGGIGGAPRVGSKSPGSMSSTLSALSSTMIGPSSTSGSIAPSGANGQIGIEVLLSPDLEARIVENSMNSVADVVTKIRRSKQ